MHSVDLPQRGKVVMFATRYTQGTLWPKVCDARSCEKALKKIGMNEVRFLLPVASLYFNVEISFVSDFPTCE